MLNRKFWKQENVNFYSGWKKALLLVNLEIPSIRLHHRSWDSMTHSTCTIILPCLVRCSCRKNLQQRKPFSVIQKINKNVKFWHSLKVKPWFLILLTNLNTGATQWRVGVGRQRDAKVREAGERGTGSARRENPTPPPRQMIDNGLSQFCLLGRFCQSLTQNKFCSWCIWKFFRFAQVRLIIIVFLATLRILSCSSRFLRALQSKKV